MQAGRPKDASFVAGPRGCGFLLHSDLFIVVTVGGDAGEVINHPACLVVRVIAQVLALTGLLLGVVAMR